VIKFRIRGNLRFLSHAEMLKVFQRACARSGLNIEHTQGFNPRPRLSLPLPKSVGVEAEEDLLCVRVDCDDPFAPDGANDARAADSALRIKAQLSRQLPRGCELLSVGFAKPDVSLQPCSATYILLIRPEYLKDALKTRIERLLATESLHIERQTGEKNSKFKNVDVRPFVKSIELDDRGIVVECKISPAGSIRLDEILRLLELDVEKLAAPVRRTTIQWKSN